LITFYVLGVKLTFRDTIPW